MVILGQTMEDSNSKDTKQSELKVEEGGMESALKVQSQNEELKEIIVDSQDTANTNPPNNKHGLDNTRNANEDINCANMQCLPVVKSNDKETTDSQKCEGYFEAGNFDKDGTDDKGFHTKVPVDSNDKAGEMPKRSSSFEAEETLKDSDGWAKYSNCTAVTEPQDASELLQRRNLFKNSCSTKTEDSQEDLSTKEEAEEKEKTEDPSEMYPGENGSTAPPEQVTDNEESEVLQKSIISQDSRRSVTFSVDDKATEMDKNIHESPQKQPFKTRKSRMQILDEIASAATEVADDFDSIGKNR